MSITIDPATSLKIISHEIHGAILTREAIIIQCLQDAYRGQNVEEVAHGIMAAGHALEALDIFETVSLTVDRIPGKSGKLPDGQHVAKLIVTVKEKRPANLRVTTFVEGGQGGMEMQGGLRNFLGFAERINVSYIAGGGALQDFKNFSARPKRSQLRADVYHPKFRGTPFAFVASADTQSQIPYQDPYEHVSHGFAMGFSRPNLSIEWLARHRDVFPQRSLSDVYKYDCPIEILNEAKPSIKSALVLRLSTDWHEEAINGDSLSKGAGGEGQLKMEFAHPRFTGGDVALASISTRWRRQFPISQWLGNGVQLATSVELTGVKSLNANGSLPLIDRLFLGGPMSIWGFDYRGAGPRSSVYTPVNSTTNKDEVGASTRTCALGGAYRWQTRIALEGPSPLEAAGSAILRTQVFATLGGISNDVGSLFRLSDTLRASLGAGISIPTPIAKLELNAVYVARALNGDVFNRFKIQFGLGAEFL